MSARTSHGISRYTSAEKGFTLIELLVVIAIIGLLSSVILGSLNSARKKGRDARRLADVKQLQVALELYYSNQTTPAYPSALSALVTDGDISAVPTDPSTGSNYNYTAYTVSSVIASYCIGAVTEATVPSPSDSCTVPSGASPSTEPTGTFRVGP
ncbi:prepilin-type N-terminal cleavage/methylation domain-containing protein [Candidatus Kaiserbacteria bacterium]|nr:prepilin-type N-terminal cleavage/methylation domain-containing protein [Candidatus Kaiserbacteria bacterium]